MKNEKKSRNNHINLFYMILQNIITKREAEEERKSISTIIICLYLFKIKKKRKEIETRYI